MSAIELIQVFDGHPAHAGFIREALVNIGRVDVLVITYFHGRVQLHVHVSEVEKAVDLYETLYAFLSALSN